MTKELIISTLLLIITGIMISVFSSGILKWLGLLIGLFCIIGPIGWYYSKLLQKLNLDGNLSDTDIDSVYYYGFLITLITLAVTIIIVGMDSSILSGNMTKIIPQFGFGLLATGTALLCRLDLLSKGERNKIRDVDKTVGRLGQNIDQLTGRFDTLSRRISDLADNANIRSHSLLTTFEAAETQFNARLANAAELFHQLAKASASKLKQAENELETAIQRVQKRELHLEHEFNKAVKKFNALLELAAQDSLGKTTAVIDQSTQQFGKSIIVLSDEIRRMQEDLKTLDFNDAAQYIEALAKTMETSLSSIQSSMHLTSQNASDAINKLTTAAKDAQTLAVIIAENLDSLKNLDLLVAQIENTKVGLKQLSDTAARSGDSLLGLGGAAADAATASGHLSINAENAASSLVRVAETNGTAVEAITKLTATANETHIFTLKIADDLHSMKAVEHLTMQVNQASESMEKLVSVAVQSGVSIFGLGNNVRELGTASSELTANIQDTSTSLKEVKEANHEAAKAIVELADTTRQNTRLADEIGKPLTKGEDTVRSNTPDKTTSLKQMPETRPPPDQTSEELNSTVSRVVPTTPAEPHGAFYRKLFGKK